MAVKNTASRSRSAKAGTAKQRASRRQLWRKAFGLLRRGASFSRPRTLSQAFVALLVVCSLSVAGIEAYSWGLRHQRPDGELTWPIVLLCAALCVRKQSWWRAELQAMTLDRARNFAIASLVVFITVCVTVHTATVELGFSTNYPLPGPFAQGDWAIASLMVLAACTVLLLLRVPVHRLAGGAAQTVFRSFGGLRSAVASTSERATLETAAFEPRPIQPLSLEPAVVEEERIGTLFPPVEVPRKGSRTVEPVIAGEQPESDRISRAGTLLPPLSILTAAPRNQVSPIDVEYISTRIAETLASFNVAARVVGHHVGPVVTQFDIQPDRGVKVKSITALQNDLALALAAPTIRIQAPVPGKPVVGIEIPNASAQTVYMRDLLEDKRFVAGRAPLTVVLGKDVAGAPALIDLAKMPHLLIAGATGSGKSVCVNALISCLLFNNTPDDLRLLMIDPKMVELTVYNGVPHLLSNVVTQMDRVVGILQWALREMERRYQMFADSMVRNIARFNEKMESQGMKKLPYIVIIVDELADLMMVSPEDVEDAICRLAQLARAAGMHLVIATQRPSVDVVTGLIKANFPARIAFAMSSQVDSRTILDMAGAEKLLGRGDMLYMPPDAPKPVRLQGTNVTDQEIERLVEFWHRAPLLEAIQRVSEEEFVAAEKASAADGDDLIEEATRVVREYQHASVSLLQRRLKIGYSRGARIIDQLEERGVVAPADGAKQRRVLDFGETGSTQQE